MLKAKRKRHSNPIVLLLLMIMALSLSAAFFIKYRSLSASHTPSTAHADVQQLLSNGAGRAEAGLKLYSSNAILFNPDSGEIIYSKNAEEKIYPASLTKIMTALLAIENIESLNSFATLEYADYAGLYEQNAAMAGFVMGETVTARDLLYATLLPSGAEAACAIARVACGSQERFIEKMNSRAEELGMKNTHFVNVTGLHDSLHYTTVSDMAKLLNAALKNDDFSAAFSQLYYTTTQTEQHPEGLRLVSTIVSRLKQLQREKPPIAGNKTGYTEEAQLCLASVAESNGVRRAVISVGAKGDSVSPPTHLTDAYLLYEKSLPKS